MYNEVIKITSRSTLPWRIHKKTIINNIFVDNIGRTKRVRLHYNIDNVFIMITSIFKFV